MTSSPIDLPASLTAASRSFLERLIASAAADERVRALFLGGSHAAGTADQHADLDLYLITADAAFADFRADRRGFLHGLGDVVFLEEHEQFGFLMLLYAYTDGVHGEIALAPTSDLATIHRGAYTTLVDKDGLLGGREFPPGRLDADERREVVRKVLVWFWYDRRLADVALARGQLWTAQYYLDRCRQACVNLARLRAQPDVWPGGYEKVEQVADASVLSSLARTVVPLDQEALVEAARSLDASYRQLGAQVADATAVPFPTRLADAVRRNLACP